MKTLELFGRSGGMAEGFRRAGLPMSFAFDWDVDACTSYEANLHHRPVQMDARDLVHLLEWPWDTASTTVNGQGRLAPHGHHPESGSMLSLPDAIVLSEKAAAILQGFPDGWVFSGKTKKSRWSQIGMAMPPPLAHAVATSVRAAMG